MRIGIRLAVLPDMPKYCAQLPTCVASLKQPRYSSLPPAVITYVDLEGRQDPEVQVSLLKAVDLFLVVLSRGLSQGH